MAADSAPQPDLEMRIANSPRWRLQGLYAVGAPELANEVSLTASARDSGSKLKLYERSRELVSGRHVEIQPDADGIYRSRVFPGLWLDPVALWAQPVGGRSVSSGSGGTLLVGKGGTCPRHCSNSRSRC